MRYEATITRWIDADTFECRVDLGFSVTIDVRARLARIDAWETRGAERPKGKAAAADIETKIPTGSTIEITPTDIGTYGRVIAEAWHAEIGNLSDYLLAAGHAQRYQKKTRSRKRNLSKWVLPKSWQTRSST